MDSGNTSGDNELFNIFAIAQTHLFQWFPKPPQEIFKGLFSGCFISLTERRYKVTSFYKGFSTDEMSVKNIKYSIISDQQAFSILSQCRGIAVLLKLALLLIHLLKLAALTCNTDTIPQSRLRLQQQPYNN